jgi:hypothetical protein
MCFYDIKTFSHQKACQFSRNYEQVRMDVFHDVPLSGYHDYHLDPGQRLRRSLETLDNGSRMRSLRPTSTFTWKWLLMMQ